MRQIIQTTYGHLKCVNYQLLNVLLMGVGPLILLQIL